MRIILTIAGLGKEFGGPSRSVPALAAALGSLGADVELITSAPAGSEAPLLPPQTLVRSHLVDPASRRTRWFVPGNAFAATLRARCAGRRDTVIHDHGIWLPSNHAVAVAARRLDTPRIVSPRGMLSSWALTASGLKKKAAWTLYQRGDLMRAAALHATSESEAADCRRTGYQGRIDVVANGTEFPPACDDVKTSPLVSERVRRTVLYLGRVHPVKGLTTLIDAWAQVRPVGWRLLIAGQDADGYAAELQQRIAANGLQEDVQVLGAVDGTDRWALYRSADLFVLPSHSESFGIVIAEALASGVPVLTTRGTPWSEIATQRCGWWIDIGLVPLVDTLRTALATPSAELHAMGDRGRSLAESKYTWDGVAREMLSFYESVARRHRDRPIQ
jgi:glycosyltransferase involved in cell wall biosynthesis